ncbi:MAG: hypothetical protein LRY71_00475 [Bacillaceae bacterium]|nr:hypothetical protein [Bacillaceae bacterium]
MGTITAQLLVGTAHPYEGGICGITHTLQLSEGSRPAWILTTTKGAKKTKITWIPTIEYMLEDALLMIGLYVWKDETLCQMKQQYFQNEQQNDVWLYDVIEPNHLERMRARCREIVSTSKIVISVFEGSTIKTQLQAIQAYEVDAV